MKSVCIVSTQMQLLNCVELIRSLKIECNDLFIIAPTSKRKEQILGVIEVLSYKSLFETITILEPKYKWSFLNSLYCRNRIHHYFSGRQFDTIVLSNYKEILVRYSYFCAWKKQPSLTTYLVDDGLSLLEIVRRRNHELANNEASISINSRHLFLVFPIRRLKKCIAPKLVFFTNHKLKDLSRYDELIINDYRHLRKTDAANLQLNYNASIFIIGQPLSQQGIVDKNVYNDYLLSFIEENNCHNGFTCYVPHPVEVVDNNLDDRIRQMINIVTFELPFEIYALSFPSSMIIVGFYSAALYNVHMIRPDLRVVCIYPRNGQNCFRKDERIINNAYATLLSSGIEPYYG